MTHCFPHSFNYRPLWIPDTWSPETLLLAYGLTSVRKVILSFLLSFQNSSEFQTLLGLPPGFCPRARIVSWVASRKAFWREKAYRVQWQSTLLHCVTLPCNVLLYLGKVGLTIRFREAGSREIGSYMAGSFLLAPHPSPELCPRTSW